MLNKKGFTIIELIMSFVFSSILAVSLFAVILNYRDSEVNTSIETRLLAFKSELMIDVEQDIQKYGLESIDYCKNPSSGANIPRCIEIKFINHDPKEFQIKEEAKVDNFEDLNGSDVAFNYTIPYITYGGIRYDIPDGANVVISNDYLLEYTTAEDGLESNTPLYKIRVNLIHNDLDADVDISIVAEGSENVNTGTMPYTAYNIGDRVSVVLSGSSQAMFRVIKKTNGYERKVVLIYDDAYSTLVPNLIQFNTSRSNGNSYVSSSIQSKVNEIASSWINADEVRLISSEEVGYLIAACPKFREVDAANVNITGSTDLLNWLLSSSFWTMSAKKVSNAANQNKLVWYVDKASHRIADAYVDSSFALRPVIVIDKEYIAFSE